MGDDPFNLQRFVDAQDPVFRQVCAELAAGAKTSHWMWFVFPQLAALGRSATAKHFGIPSRDEALAYSRHALLWPRLKQCCELVLAVQGKTALQILGPPDDIKLRSSMTLFDHVGAGEGLFAQVLQKYFDGQGDPRTVELL